MKNFYCNFVMQEYVIHSIVLDDLKDYGYDASTLTDDDMRKLAKKLSDMYVEYSFREDLEMACEKLGISKIEER